MNWPRIILDGLSMSLVFNAVAGLGFLLWPQAYSTMFPKEIRQAAAPFVEKKTHVSSLMLRHLENTGDAQLLKEALRACMFTVKPVQMSAKANLKKEFGKR